MHVVPERLDTLSRGEIAGLIVVLVAVLGGAGRLVCPLTAQAGHDRPGGTRRRGAGIGVAESLRDGHRRRCRRGGAARRVRVRRGRWRHRRDRAGGGQLPKADLSLLNLAALRTDGTILVPKAGPPGAVVPGAGTTGSSGGLININSASATELETLSGIGEVLAATMEYREQNGPFASVDDLMDVSGIGPATLEEHPRPGLGLGEQRVGAWMLPTAASAFALGPRLGIDAGLAGIVDGARRRARVAHRGMVRRS